MNAVQEFISITPWTIIFQICNLLILFALIKKFLFKRVMAVLDARQQEIEVVPTLVLYRGGRELDSIVAPESQSMIEAFLRRALKE